MLYCTCICYISLWDTNFDIIGFTKVVLSLALFDSLVVSIIKAHMSVAHFCISTSSSGGGSGNGGLLAVLLASLSVLIILTLGMCHSSFLLDVVDSSSSVSSNSSLEDEFCSSMSKISMSMSITIFTLALIDLVL
jgi:hypothetical protein